jgi:Leucine-rich repeat (LRR) protein
MKKLLLILLALPMIGFGQNVNIPDANFKAYLVGNSAINTNGDTEIQVSEATVFNGNISCNGNMADLTGIEAFTALTVLYCYNNQITSLDVSNNTALTSLYCSYNQLTSLDVSSATALTHLDCEQNQLTSLDVSNNTSLTSFGCSGNQLTSLDVTQNTALTQLQCNNNQLTTLDLSQNTSLTWLNCYDNQLTSLNLNGATALEGLYAWNNQLVNLDVSQNTSLISLLCNNNQLISLDLSQISCALQINESDFSENPNLNCVEVTDLSCWQNNYIGFLDTTYQYYSTNCSGTSIQEHSTNKELLKVTDILGRKTKGTKNEVLFYIYDDGTVEKRIVIE